MIKNRITLRNKQMLEWAIKCLRDGQVLYRGGLLQVVVSVNHVGGFGTCYLEDVVEVRHES